jgi:integrase
VVTSGRLFYFCIPILSGKAVNQYPILENGDGECDFVSLQVENVAQFGSRTERRHQSRCDKGDLESCQRQSWPEVSLWKLRLCLSLQGVAGAAEQMAKSTSKRVTVADAIEVFLEDVKAGKSKKTHQARERMLALFIESCSKEFLAQITEADCEQFIRFLRKHYNSPKGARTVYNVFQGLNTFLRAQKVFSAGQLLGKLEYDQKIVDAYTKDELRALKAVCTEEERLVWEFFWWSAAKEVSHEESCDLDFRKNVLHVQPKPHRNWKGKDKEDRFIPLPPPLMEELRERKRKGKAELHDLIFPAENGA